MAVFKVSDQTTKILKNFAGISNMLLLKEGQSQRTMLSSKAVLALAELPDAWPMETGIYDLNLFLGALSLMKGPGIEFGDESMKIKSGGSTVRYRYSDPSTIQQVPSKTLPTANPALEFTLDSALQQLNKTCSLLTLSTVTISVAAGAVVLRAADAKMPNSHAFEFTVDEKDVTLHDPSFETTINFKQEYLEKLMDGAYTVSLSSAWKYGYFKHSTEPVSYFVVGAAV